MFGGTEFGSGSLAGDEGLGGLLFILAAILIFKYPRIAPVSGLAAAYLSLPLFVYLVFPRPFRQVFPGNWSVPDLPREKFVWDGWWAAGILLMVGVTCFCSSILIRSILTRRKNGAARPGNMEAPSVEWLRHSCGASKYYE